MVSKVLLHSLVMKSTIGTIIGELIFMTIRDSEAFEKSSSLVQGFLKFIDYPMCKRDEDIDFWSGNIQIQP